MSKKLVGILTIAIVVTVAGYNLYTAQKSEEVVLSELALANVEALANDEYGNGNGGIILPCFSSVRFDQGQDVHYINYCGSCGFSTQCTHYDGGSFCTWRIFW